MILVSLSLVSLSLIPLSLLLLSLLLLLPITVPVPVMPIILMFHHHGRRRCRSLLTPHRTYRHHAANQRSSHHLRPHDYLSFLAPLQNLSSEMQLPAPQAPQAHQITHLFAHISCTLRKS